MSKNLIPEICKMLGVELGEEFKIKGHASFEQKTYRFTAHGLRGKIDQHQEAREFSAIAAFNYLVLGNAEIVKLPWKPKNGDVYYTFVRTGIDCTYTLISYRWDGCVIDIALLKAGWVYRTKEEAKAALPAVAKEMNVEFIV